MEPAQTSSFELGVVNHRSTPRFEDDTAARDIFPRANEDDMDEDVFLPRENGGEGREEEERNVVEIPRGYRRPRRELMRQIPVTDPMNDGARVRSNRVAREVEFSRNEYRNFWNVSKKVVACVLLAACAGLVYICTHEFGHAAACALTKEHRVVKISILSVTIFERPVTFDYAPREEEDAEDNHNDDDEEHETMNNDVIRPIGDEHRSISIQSNSRVQGEQVRSPSKVGYTTCATVQTYAPDIFLIDRKEAWIKVSGYLSTLILQVLCVSVAFCFNSIIAASFMFPDTFFYAWKRYPNEVQEGFSVLMFKKILHERPSGVSLSSEFDFSNTWDEQNTALAYILTAIGIALLLCQTIVFAVVIEKRFRRRLDLVEERARLPPLRIPRARSDV